MQQESLWIEQDGEFAHSIGVLALGNLLCRDEGIGIHVLQSLRKIIPEGIALCDGGTAGLELLGFLEGKQRLIILDAVDDGRAPGEVVIWRDSQVPRYTEQKMSLHQMSFAEVLCWADFTGVMPEELVVIGVQPESIDSGIELTASAQNSIPKVMECVVRFLQDWGALS